MDGIQLVHRRAVLKAVMSVHIKFSEFIEPLSDYQLLKKDCSIGLPNIQVEWVASVHCTWVVLGLSLDSHIGYPTKGFRGFPPFFPTMNG